MTTTPVYLLYRPGDPPEILALFHDLDRAQTVAAKVGPPAPGQPVVWMEPSDDDRTWTLLAGDGERPLLKIATVPLELTPAVQAPQPPPQDPYGPPQPNPGQQQLDDLLRLYRAQQPVTPNPYGPQQAPQPNGNDLLRQYNRQYNEILAGMTGPTLPPWHPQWRPG